MGSTPGDFGTSTAHRQCTALSKRSQERCKGPAVTGSDKCRMHSGFSGHAIGANNKNFKHGRSSAYLPAQLGSLYEESLSDPELLSLESHIALLQGKMHEILGESTSDNPVPTWGDFAAASGALRSAVDLPADDPTRADRIADAADMMNKIVAAGREWDTTWTQILGYMEQIRKLADVEIRRKRELNHFIPIERVMILFTALADTVKRCVSNPIEIQRIQTEFAKLVQSDLVPQGNSLRVSAAVTDIQGLMPRPKRRHRAPGPPAPPTIDAETVPHGDQP